MCFMRDEWCLGGQVFGHPEVGPGEYRYVGTPRVFDKSTMTITTWSGSKYVLGECADDINKQIAYIEEDCARS
jgi:hypothetical protein